MNLFLISHYFFDRKPTILCRIELSFLSVLILSSIQYHSYGQGNKDEPKPSKRLFEYQGKGSGDYVQELRAADNDFDKGSYSACSASYIKYADSLDKEQHNRFGWLYYMGYGVKKDYSMAKKQFKLAVKDTLAQSNYYLGVIKFKESLDPKDNVGQAEAYRYFQVAADLGDPEAMNSLGLKLEESNFLERNDKKEIKENYRKAAEWYFKAAQLGSSNGMVNLGDCYAGGRGVKKDKDSALKWFMESALLGNDAAMYNLGNGYRVGESPLRKNYDSALKWYRLAAENGHAYSMTNIGYMYEKGIGVTVDYSEAIRWYKKGAEAGDPYAAKNIGHMYNFGIGVKKNVDTAMLWYNKAETLHLYVLDQEK